MRLLLVEDDFKIASFILKGMKAEGYAVDHASDGQEGLHMAVTEPYDAAIIDVMLPKLDGLSLIERMRKEKVNTPVIVLSAKGSVDDRVKGLQVGGDDYLPKPFAFSELLARIQALIRRAGGLSEPAHLTYDDLKPGRSMFLFCSSSSPDFTFPAVVGETHLERWKDSARPRDSSPVR